MEIGFFVSEVKWHWHNKHHQQLPSFSGLDFSWEVPLASFKSVFPTLFSAQQCFFRILKTKIILSLGLQKICFLSHFAFCPAPLASIDNSKAWIHGKWWFIFTSVLLNNGQKFMSYSKNEKRAKIYLDFKRVLFFITLYIRRQQFSVILTPQTCQRLKLSWTAIIHNTKGLQITSGNKFD